MTDNLKARLAHELREQSRFPSGMPRISPAKANSIVEAATSANAFVPATALAKAVAEVERLRMLVMRAGLMLPRGNTSFDNWHSDAHAEVGDA